MYSNSLDMVSPMIVERKCPTCIDLAIFGAEKSTQIVIFSYFGGSGYLLGSFMNFETTFLIKNSSVSVKLTKIEATVASLIISFLLALIASTSFFPSSLGELG